MRCVSTALDDGEAFEWRCGLAPKSYQWHRPYSVAFPKKSKAVLTHRTPKSLADAELAEDAIQHVVGINRADNLAKMFEHLSQFDDH